MTTTVDTSQSGPTIASGTANIPFTFQSISAAEIEVTRNGAVALPATYTVTRNADGTGYITPTSTWGVDEVYIYSKPNFDQTADFVRGVPVYPDLLNPILDRIVRTIIGAYGMLMREVADTQGAPGVDGSDAVNPNYSYAVDTLAPGSPHTLVASGVYPNILLTFGTARGDPGASGALGDGTYGGITVSGTGSVLSVVAGHITLARMANLPANTFIGNNTGGSAVPLALTVAQVKTALAIDNVTNTSDANKPVSTAQQAALDLKASIAYVDSGLAGKSAAFLGAPVDISSDTTLSDATHNNKQIRFTGGTTRTITLNSTPSAGFMALAANRASVSFTLSIAGGAYLNGATSTVTTITAAVGADFTMKHETGGVWVVKGTGLS
jgi:hypothetical protein